MSDYDLGVEYKPTDLSQTETLSPDQLKSRGISKSNLNALIRWITKDLHRIRSHSMGRLH